MSLHRRHSAGKKALDVTQASGDLSLSVPKYKIPPAERSARTAYALVHDELLLDGNSRQNLGAYRFAHAPQNVRGLLWIQIGEYDRNRLRMFVAKMVGNFARLQYSLLRVDGSALFPNLRHGDAASLGLRLRRALGHCKQPPKQTARASKQNEFIGTR